MRNANFFKCNVESKTAVKLTAAICLKLNHTMNGLVIIIRFFYFIRELGSDVFKQNPNIDAFGFAFDVVTFCISFMFSDSLLYIFYI